MSTTLEKAVSDLHIATTLSKRGAATGSGDEFMIKYLGVASKNPYHAVGNPEGIVNLGTAVNRLMEKELHQRLSSEDVLRFRTGDHQYYFEFRGTEQCREAISNFLERHFSGGRPVPAEQLVIMNGVTSCLENLAYFICDDHDVMITPTPVYGRIFTNFQDRSRVDVQPLHLLPKEGSDPGEDFELDPESLEAKILELTAAGKNVRAFILINPQNPMGNIYSHNLVLSLLKICAKYEMHAIIDEIYGLSLLGDSTVTSVLAIDNWPDPQRTHFLWGMSKDFALPGMRLGVIHTRNQELLKSLSVTSLYQATPSVVQDLVATLLSDTKWCDEQFLPCSRRRLTACHQLAKSQLQVGGVHVHHSKAALFAWVNITPYMKELTEQEEIAVFEELISAGVYGIPGSVLHCGVVGWFRLVVSVPEDELRLGLERLLAVLHARRPPPLEE